MAESPGGSKPKRRLKSAAAQGPATRPGPRKKTQEEKQREEWEAIAQGLKDDGYNASVVTRKMIQIHGMKEADAETLVGGLYGKRVSARTGDTTAAILGGLGLAAAASLAIVVLWLIVGIFPVFMLLVYAALLGVVGKGLTQAVIAAVNANAKEDLIRKEEGRNPVE